MSSKNLFNGFNFDKLFGNKKFLYIVILICAAVVLFCFNFDTKNSETTQDSSTSLTEYKNNLTSELCAILGKIEGVGKVNVLITFDSDTDQEVVYNTKETTSQNGQNTSNTTISKDAVMMKDGTVNIPYTIKNDIPDIKGVLIVAQGADDENVKEKIKDAVVTILKIPSYRAVVLPMSK
jgi:stage III sporulation protein AG